MTGAIEIRQLTKDFALPMAGKRLRAVDALSLRIEKGEVYGLLGPNGSGKSTAIKAVLGLSKPTAGECFLMGLPAGDSESRRQVGYLPEAPYFPRFLTGRELLEFYADLAGVSKSGRKAAIAGLLDKVGLDDAGDRRVGGYSKGMLQRIGLAQALVGDPELLILDEPTAGVDPEGAADIAAIIGQLKSEGKTILLCSHLLSQVEEVCDRIGIMRRGKLRVEGSVAALLKPEDGGALRVSGIGPEARAEIARIVAEQGGRMEAGSLRLEELYLKVLSGSEDGR